MTPKNALSPSFPFSAPRSTIRALRAWQQAALDIYQAKASRDFLAVATPGAGKTTFALRVASELLADGVVQAITIVTPTEHLKYQWAEASHRAGISVDPAFSNGQGAASRDYTGVAVTYAQVAAHPALHLQRTAARRTLVILDEVHHGGDALSWGDAVREAFTPATRRLALTGTPFRSDTSPIPFVTYAPMADGITRSVADYVYGYGQALRDHVVRPVLFLAYSGEMRWRTTAGVEMTATLGEPLTDEQTALAWRTALDPGGDWIAQVLSAADVRLSQVRSGGMPDAAGLVIASDIVTARAYAGLLHARTGRAPVVVLSDDPQASRKIEAFTDADDRWMVAVRMVSEGVDLPRLAVGVYATSVSTPLYFAQAVGRFVRARGRTETASLFVPSVPSLLALAAEMETERDHALNAPDAAGFLEGDPLLAAQGRQDEAGEELVSFEALEASAHFDRVLYDGAEFGTHAAVGSAEEEDYLGLPGLLDRDQVAVLLRQRQAQQVASQSRASRRTTEVTQVDSLEARRATHHVLSALRRELNGLVSAYHHRTSKPHGMIHAEIRKVCGGPPSAQATEAQLRERIQTLTTWARRPTG